MKKLLLMLMLMAPLATFAQKFGKVNTQTIMQNLPEIAKINGELQATAKQYENDLKGMQDELKRQSDAYDKAKSTMNPTAQKQKEEELNTLYQKSRTRCSLSWRKCAKPLRMSAKLVALPTSSKRALLSTQAPM